MLVWISRTAEQGKIDNELKQQYETESQYWSEVLKRVVAVFKFTSERGLAFRGDDQQFGSPQNGNYLGCLELISQFDPFLRKHIVQFSIAGKGTPSCLSSTVCEELIDPIFIVRYVSEEGSTEECFLKFLPISSHTGESLFNSVISVLTEMNINIENCCGQCFENGTNMSGVYKGVQSHIRQVNPLAEWVPCVAHTLSLVGVNAVNCCLETDVFFTFVQSLFNCCSKSTWRWQIMSNLEENEKGACSNSEILVKHKVENPCTNYIFQSLQTIADDDHQNLTTRNEATSPSRQMKNLAILCSLWKKNKHRTSKWLPLTFLMLLLWWVH